jgi:hypothetical protein
MAVAAIAEYALHPAMVLFTKKLSPLERIYRVFA